MIFVFWGGTERKKFVTFLEGITERKNLLLLKKQTPSNAVSACWVGWTCYDNDFS